MASLCTQALLAAGAGVGARTADSAGRTALQLAAAAALPDTVLALLAGGASHADATSDAAWTALHFAAQVGGRGRPCGSEHTHTHTHTHPEYRLIASREPCAPLIVCIAGA
jgi:hypothetical protein